MGAKFPRRKTWTGDEDVLTSDLNGEFDNILQNLTPSGVDDYSSSVAQMQIQTNPGEAGSESLASSTAGEIERLRFEISRIVGKTYHYQAPPISLVQAQALINQIQAIPNNRIISGRARASQQPVFLVPDGATNTVRLKAASTNFVVFIDGVQYTINTDLAITNLSLAPSSNNTALVNDPVIADQSLSRIFGERDSYPLTIDTAGTEITTRVGQYAAFRFGTEYFFGLVKSATQISDCFRGYFFDSVDAPVRRETIADNDTITLMRLSWIYLRNTSLLNVSYTNPVYSATTPASGNIGDYWFDSVNQQWKLFNGTSWVADGAILVGVCLQDGSATVAARSFDFYYAHNDTNNITLEVKSNTEIQGNHTGQQVTVYGTNILFDHFPPRWDITTHLATSTDMYNATEQASTMYYLYIGLDQTYKISDIQPHRRDDLKGYYHPFNPWRCVGLAYNNASSNLIRANGITLRDFSTVYITDGNGHGSSGTGNTTRRYNNETENNSALINYLDDASEGASFTCYWPTKLGIHMTDTRGAGATDSGVLKNESAADLGTAVLASVTANPSKTICFQSTAAGDYAVPSASVVGCVGDVFRPRTSGNSDATDTYNSNIRFGVSPR